MKLYFYLFIGLFFVSCSSVTTKNMTNIDMQFAPLPAIPSGDYEAEATLIFKKNIIKDKEFLKNYTKHDLIIFAVTHPDRYTKRFNWCDKPKNIINNGYISNYETVIDFKNKATNEQDKKMLTHLEGWYVVSNEVYNDDMHELMLQHMESLHKNIIFYLC